MKTTLLSLSLLAATLAALPAAAQTAKRPAPAAAPVAKPLPPGILGKIQLSQVRLEEVARLLSDVGNANVVVTSKVSDEVVSLYLRNASVDDMVRNVCRAAGVWFRYDSTSKTYVIMSASEYQKDLAIVRDEKTQVFTLRHHNVVATANAVKALFGSRVTLSVPVEEMPPTSLGSGNRTSTGGRGGAGGSGTSSGNRSGNNGSGGSGNTGTGTGGFGDQSQSGQGRGSAAAGQGGGGATNYDPAADLARLSLERLAGQSHLGANGQAVLATTDVQDMAARQGPAILVTYNKLNNLLMVRTGDEQALKEIGKLVADMDKPPKQVLLEMKILEVTLDDGYRSVFDIGLGSRGTTSGPSGWGGSSNTNGITARNSAGSGMFGIEDNANLIWQVMSNNLSLRLQLLANENKLKILSSPMLVAANNQAARLFIGDERILTVGASSQSATGTTGATNTTVTVETEKRDVGQTLAILPRINGDRSVSLTVDQDSSTVRIGDATIPLPTAGGGVFQFPVDTVNTASLQLTAHARDGMTVAIGGMIRETVVRDDEKVPVLGDVPGLGFFFKRDVRSKVRTQIVLLITPRIIENAEEGDSIATAKTQDFNAATATFPTSKTVPKLTNTWPVAPPTGIDRSNARDGDAAYAALARSAAAAVLQNDPGKAPPDGLRAVPPGQRSALTLDNGMPAAVRGSWQRDGLYVTALRVSNESARNATLQAIALPGRWSAIVIENPELGPDGSAEAATWLYAISRQPFEESLDLP
jgi:type II secretory pathway component GspD/PulD (secretin)